MSRRRTTLLLHTAFALLGVLLVGPPTARGGEAGDPLPVRFEPGVAGSREAPRYSPKGFRVALEPSERELTEGLDPLEGRLLLGPPDARGQGHLVVVARSKSGTPYDRLWIDTDGDGSLEDEALRSAEPRLARGNVTTSYEAVLEVAHEEAIESDREPYPIGLWITVEAEDETPAFLRFSRHGFLVGPATIDGRTWHVVLSDADHDATYGPGDWWTILPADGEATNDIARSRRVGDFAWADREAFHLELEGTRGRVGRLVPFDPGLTPEEDARARDPYWDDKHAERAEEPVPFRHDVDAALADAVAQERPCFLDFETVWCGPCKYMDRWVYTAKDVVAAAEGIVCVKVDGDERKDLKARYDVGAFPTGILLAPDGTEIARFRGYQGVEDVVAFLAKAREGAGPAEPN